MKNRTVLAFLAHPDDTDNYCAHFLRSLVSAGREVHLCSFTRGEHGLGGNRDPGKEAFRGTRLGRIRSRELVLAARHVGIPAEQVHFLDIEDGTVARNARLAYASAREIVASLEPGIVLMPEFYDGYYKHPDHVYAGMVAFLATRREAPRAMVMLYHSLSNNYFHPADDVAFGEAAIKCHASQADFFRFIRPFYVNVEQIVNGFKSGGSRRAEGYRVTGTWCPQRIRRGFSMLGKLFALFAGTPVL
ncbi:MAG: PIG-L family deacetylase [Candidatus Lokiarchaeota archaeon]|nr:PIG-L family deacetylase [Candidatus Lokiarchaeota archaeon]